MWWGCVGWRGGGERRKVEGREGRGEEGKGEGGRKWKGSGMEGVRRKVEERKEGVCVCSSRRCGNYNKKLHTIDSHSTSGHRDESGEWWSSRFGRTFSSHWRHTTCATRKDQGGQQQQPVHAPAANNIITYTHTHAHTHAHAHTHRAVP